MYVSLIAMKLGTLMITGKIKLKSHISLQHIKHHRILKVPC